MQETEIKCRWAPSLGLLEGTSDAVWGTTPYNPETDLDKPCVFFGLYGFPDFYALWRHRGKKWILWAGSDITHFRNGYWLDEKGEIRVDPQAFSDWIIENCESWVENDVERIALNGWGIESQICPSFMGNSDDFEISYQPSEKPKVYTSVSGNNFKLYGWDKIPQLAQENPNIEFHLYGNTEPPFPDTVFKPANIFIHGRVSKEEMNREIRDMQGALRLTEFDGFSEILAKSVLMGQWPVSLIEYPHMLEVSEINKLKNKTEPNILGYRYYKGVLNNYPWNLKK